MGVPFPSGVGSGRGCARFPGNFWTFAFKMVHFGAFWKALLTQQRHPPAEDFAILYVNNFVPFRAQEAQYTNRKYCWNINTIRNWTLVTSCYRVTARTSVCHGNLVARLDHALTPVTIRRRRLGAWRHAWYVDVQSSIYRPTPPPPKKSPGLRECRGSSCWRLESPAVRTPRPLPLLYSSYYLMHSPKSSRILQWRKQISYSQKCLF